MRFYRHCKYWLCMVIGMWAIYHDAQYAAIALFILAAIQPAIDALERRLEK